MAESTKAPEQAPASAAPRSSLFGKIIVCVFMLTVIATECLLAYFLIPSVDEVAREAEARMTEKIHKNVDPAGHGEHEATIEVDLGQYTITSTQSETNTSLRIDFKLFGIVLEEEEHEVTEHFERAKHRLRDQVIVEIRNSTINELSDPGLGLIKRRILEKSNQLFGKSLLHEIVFSDFSFVEM